LAQAISAQGPSILVDPDRSRHPPTSMADFLPVVSQIKSAVQAVTGDKEGAVQTQYNFSRQCPVISQVRSLGELAFVSSAAAWQTQVEQGRVLNGLANGIPILGHAKSAVHYSLGQKEESLAAAKAATRTTAVVVGGLGGFCVANIPGAVAGAVSAGAAADVTTSVAESRAKGYYVPSGAIVPLEAFIDAEGPKKAGPCVDVVVVLVGDALIGFMVGRAALARQTRVAADNAITRVLGSGEDSLFFSGEDGISLFGEDGPFLAGEDGVFLGNERGPLVLQQEALAAQAIPEVPGEVRAKAHGLGFAILDEWLMLRRGSRSRQAGRADGNVMLSAASASPMLRVLDNDGEQVLTMLHLHADAQQMLAGRISPLMLQLPAEDDEEEDQEITILPCGEGSSVPMRVLSRAGGVLSVAARSTGGFLLGRAGAVGAVSKTVGFVGSLAGTVWSTGKQYSTQTKAQPHQPPVPESGGPASAAEKGASVEPHQPSRPESPVASGVKLDAWAEQLLEERGYECLEMFNLAKLTYEDDDALPPGFRKVESEAAPAGKTGAAVAAVAVRPTASLKALVRTRKPVPGRSSETDFGAVVELAFRGSANLGNWLANFTCELVTCRLQAGGKVHSGFQDSYLMLRGALLDHIRQDIQQLVTTETRVLLKVTGHSLGGALAMLAAYDLSQLLSADASFVTCETSVATFGSPRLGDQEFKESYNRVVRHTARFVNKFDPVPWLPADPEEPASNDAEAMSAVVARLLRRPLDKLGAAGFCSVCRPCELDVGSNGVASSARHWATLGSMAVRTFVGRGSSSGALIDAIDPAVSLVPHTLDEYETNLRKRLGGTSGVGAAAGELIKAIVTTAVASRASESFLVQGATTMAVNLAAERVAAMASHAERGPERTCC